MVFPSTHQLLPLRRFCYFSSISSPCLVVTASLGSVLALPFFSLLRVSVCHHHSPGGSVGKLESYLSPLFSSHSISLSSTSPACRAEPKVDPPPCTAPPRSPLISLDQTPVASQPPSLRPLPPPVQSALHKAARGSFLNTNQSLLKCSSGFPPLAERNPSSHTTVDRA